MTFTLPTLPYAYERAAPIMSKEPLNTSTTASPGLCTNGKQQSAERHRIRGQVSRGDRQGLVRQECAGCSNNPGQHYNHLHFWELDESPTAAAPIARPPVTQEDHRGPRRDLRNSETDFARRRRRPVRFGPGRGVGETRASSKSPRPPWRKPVGAWRHAGSSASTSGSIPTTSIIRIAARII